MAPRRSKPVHADHPSIPLGLDELVPVAHRVTQATGCPVIGGVAVMLHGGGRNTSDIDIHSSDLWATHQKLEAAGFLWDAKKKEHRDQQTGTPVHMVPLEMIGQPIKHVSVIRGIKVAGLADVIRMKLECGLSDIRRSKDLAHVIDLIQAVPLKKAFAAKLPPKLRAAFRALADEVYEPRRTSLPPASFRKRYAS